jgi:hypothetical protein
LVLRPRDVAATILAKQAHEEHIPLFSRRPADPSNHP